MSQRILILDDEADFVQLLRYRLQQAGYEVEYATRGMEALNKARLAAPDLIIVDLWLPDLDGLTVCEILRRQPSTRATPVILVTAADAEVTQFAAETAGVRLVLNKPLDLEQFGSAVKALLAEAAQTPVLADD
jgi:two-component system alkaline phosphatase synthesis response regulator PhoP